MLVVVAICQCCFSASGIDSLLLQPCFQRAFFWQIAPHFSRGQNERTLLFATAVFDPRVCTSTPPACPMKDVRRCRPSCYNRCWSLVAKQESIKRVAVLLDRKFHHRVNNRRCGHADSPSRRNFGAHSVMSLGRAGETRTRAHTEPFRRPLKPNSMHPCRRVPYNTIAAVSQQYVGTLRRSVRFHPTRCVHHQVSLPPQHPRAAKTG